MNHHVGSNPKAVYYSEYADDEVSPVGTVLWVASDGSEIPHPGIGDDKDVKSYLSAVKRVFGSHKRIVMSSDPIHELHVVEQPDKPENKPHGLWYDCDQEWLKWLPYNMPRWLGGYRYIYALTLNLESMHRLYTVADLRRFWQVFGAAGRNLRWNEVARRWPGLEICPYIGEARLAVDWYDSWDVASGVVWDPAAASVSLKLIAMAPGERGTVSDESLTSNFQLSPNIRALTPLRGTKKSKSTDPLADIPLWIRKIAVMDGKAGARGTLYDLKDAMSHGYKPRTRNDSPPSNQEWRWYRTAFDHYISGSHDYDDDPSKLEWYWEELEDELDDEGALTKSRPSPNIRALTPLKRESPGFPPDISMPFESKGGSWWWFASGDTVDTADEATWVALRPEGWLIEHHAKDHHPDMGIVGLIRRQQLLWDEVKHHLDQQGEWDPGWDEENQDLTELAGHVALLGLEEIYEEPLSSGIDLDWPTREMREAKRKAVQPNTEKSLVPNVVAVTPIGTTGHKIYVTYEIVTPESAEEGDTEEAGWIDGGYPIPIKTAKDGYLDPAPDRPEGIDMDNESDDLGTDIIETTVDYLEGMGANEPSELGPDAAPTWWTNYEWDHDYTDGSQESRSFHLHGYSEDERKEIYRRMKRRHVAPRRP